MHENDTLWRVTLVERLELLALDARLTGTPERLVQAIWTVLDRPSRAVHWQIGRRVQKPIGALTQVSRSLHPPSVTVPRASSMQLQERARSVMRLISLLALCSAAALVASCDDPTAPGPEAALPSVRAGAPHRITITDLGTLGGTTSMAVAINPAGVVIGEAETTDGRTYGFLWQNGTMTDLGTLPGGIGSSANGINPAGVVVGMGRPGDGPQHVVLWKNGAVTDLGTLGGTFSIPSSINSGGEIVGATYRNGLRAFSWKKAVVTDLGTLPGDNSSFAAGINGAGEVVGWSAKDEGGETSISHAVLWKDGTITDLGSLGGTVSNATAIDPAGNIVGTSVTGSGFLHAFLWKDGVMTDLGTLPGGISSGASAISPTGTIVGYGATPSGAIHAVLWRNGTVTDLGTLPGDVESLANSINPRGQVVGWSGDGAGRSRAVLWTVE